MNAGDFTKRRALIQRAPHRRKGYAARAMQALMREAGAVVIIIHGKVVGWRLPNGQVACRKRRYHTEEAASHALSAVWHDPRTPKTPHRIYHCDSCDGFHLTSQDKGQQS